MKKSASIFVILFLFSALWWFQATPARAATLNPDSLEISLLTCTPHQEVYSLYGHTAIRIEDKQLHQDYIVNYGVFDFREPHFIWRFIFAYANYEMGIFSLPIFCQEYRHCGSGVTQQVLNLSSEEKLRIFEAVMENYRPENRKYQYNFFFDNCTTRARDILINHLNEKLEFPQNQDVEYSYRDLIHQYNDDYPWTRFGCDLLLGVEADRKTTAAEREFLPDYLKNDFSKAVKICQDGSREPFVSRTFNLVEPGLQIQMSGFPLTPTQCAIVLLVITLAVVFYEYRRRVKCWWFDLLLLLSCGVCGLILVALIFSKHPCVQINFQYLLLNPLCLIFAWPALRGLRRGRVHFWWKAWMVFILLFFAGMFFQCYAEGMWILALSLLIRCLSHLMTKKSAQV